MIIADTSVWIDFLRSRRSRNGDAIARLIDTEQLALPGIVLTELLRGTRGGVQRERLEAELEGATFIEMTSAAWRRAGILMADLDSRGSPIPPSDALIAAAALEFGHELFTRDKHFDRVPGLRLYTPKEPSDD